MLRTIRSHYYLQPDLDIGTTTLLV